ncbi:MAG: hypothetical protein R6V36_08710 [Psychroflexus sp.]
MIECTKYTRINKGSCLGLATLFIDKWGVEITGISLHQKNGKRWISFPAKQYEKDGQTKYMPYFRFPDKNLYERFCAMAKEAIEKKAANSHNEVYV